MQRGEVNTLLVEGQHGMPTMSYTTPFQYGAQVRNEHVYKLHEYIDEQKLACFTNPFQTPYPKIDIDLKYFKILCEDIEDKNTGDINGQTALHALCLYGSVNALKILLESGADLFCEDLAGFSLAHYCAMSDRHDLLAYLDRAGAAITKQALATSRTPLHVASMCNSVHCIKYLLDSGVNFNQVDNYGYSALWLAMYYRNDTVCKLLSQKGAQLNVTEVDKISFAFRALEKCPEYGEWLLDSYITSCPYRGVACIWLDNLVNGVSYENTDLTHSYLYLSSPKREFIEHPVVRGYTRVAWEFFGRRSAIIDVIRDAIFSILWTFHFMSDNGKTFRDSSNVSKIVAYSLLLPYTCYMIYYMITKINCVFKKQCDYIEFEMRMTYKEIDNLHPCMWNANHVLLREKRKLTEKRSQLRMGQVLAQQSWELLINILSVIVIILDIVLSLVGENTDKKPKLQWLYMSVTSVVLVLVWASSFNRIRYFKEFGAFLVSVKRLAHLLLRFAVMYLVFYIPIACVFWKTIYEPSNRANRNGTDPTSAPPTQPPHTPPPHTSNEGGMSLTEHILTASSSIVPFPDAFYRIYRMTFSDYTYSDGLKLATEIGVPSWWNLLTFYWITVGGLILLKILGGMVFAILSEPLRESQYTAYKDRLYFICELVMTQSSSKRQEFARHLELDCKPYISDRYLQKKKKEETRDLESEVSRLQYRVNQLTEVILTERSTGSSSNIPLISI